MSELEKELRSSIGKWISIRYIIPNEGKEEMTGTLVKVTDEIIEVVAGKTRYFINRKQSFLTGLSISE